MQFDEIRHTLGLEAKDVALACITQMTL